MTAPCGTYGGYQRHLKQAETPCEECLAASAAYHRDYRKSTPERAAKKLHLKHTTDRALARLRDRHYAEYLALLAEERSR